MISDIMAKENKSLAVHASSLLLPLGTTGSGDSSTILQWVSQEAAQDGDAGDAGDDVAPDANIDAPGANGDTNCTNDAPTDDLEEGTAVPEEVQGMLEDSHFLR